MTPGQLETAITTLLAQQMPDEQLRDKLDAMAEEEISFSGFTWLWGPQLYRRNRVLFRPFVLSRFSRVMRLPKWHLKAIEWKKHAAVLEAWLNEVDAKDDVELFRKLYEWKLSEAFGWRARDKWSEQIVRDLIGRLRRADSASARQIILRKFDLWFEIKEDPACELYAIDPGLCRPFILGRIKSNWFNESGRALWHRLMQLAERGGDEELRWKLYRRQVPINLWVRDVLELSNRIKNPAELLDELEKHHPEGWGLSVADGFLQLLERRGQEVIPYVARHLMQVSRGWFRRGDYGKLADYARERGWWEFWAALVRNCSGTTEFSKEVSALLEPGNVQDVEAYRRLLLLCGVSREFNWRRFGLATVYQLDEPVVLRMYERFPELLRGPYKLHVQPHLWGRQYTQLLERFIALQDEEMIDYFAGRICTRHGRYGNAPKYLEDAEKLADYYAALKSDEVNFSRRAANVLGQIPAYSIWNYNELIRQNRLARLLFERSVSVYLADARSMADLVEAAEIHVMALAYRALGQNDQRARTLAVEHLPLLLGTLLRPMQRDTRALAFSAIANAAVDLNTARLVLERARDAMNLPDMRYPKEKLLGLIASLLHRWPELRRPEERPVIYERVAA